MTLTYERCCDEIPAQARALTAVLGSADLGRRVATCPDWTLEELVEHVGQAHRWMAEIVRTRAKGELKPEDVPDAQAPKGDAAALGTWLVAGADRAAAALRAAGAGTRVWTWWTDQRTDFWARRMVHETVVHRADACLAAGVPFTVTPEVAVDTIDEWLELVSSPVVQEEDEELQALRSRAGASLHLHATDTPAVLGAEWLIELTGEGITWRRDHAKAAVALRGELTDVLLAFYRRMPATDERVEVIGDAELLDFWLEKVSFA
ncbi:maleylpyruvate isomerase family mycothiol-dependent enzyme [Streptomyces sp. JJ38]|uniref:maleylpyruvate isomerase family mycothiol-dependent enzyme n=1 Tax=Streptomyces sp. JJ38 TaxID=2738128 RepID=UPI001C55D682|nr:maleylpyruvate isomerase family mycothiol-dependent enzyme [Streptomyces sp. JJ38]MBW1596219.1 maleylpyruvate isomerase family mycothiol-dependent enzyme [Streptomyces sp. JJ38]